ncbi:MAG: conjugal transfer protein TrbJ, partial [Acidithiobacillus caldus]|nr:conjugal transfer protein TrbJ [Acidithiobacillus caldus]
MKKIAFSVGLALLSLSPVAIAGGGLTGGATLPEQIVQEGTAVEQLAKQVQEVETQIAQYENMIQNMEQLPQSLLGKILQPVDQLYGLVSQAQSLTTNAINIGNQFQNLNASFNPQITAEYTDHYESISQGLNNALNNLIASAGLNPANFANQQEAEQKIQSAMNDPQSRNKILQAAVAVGQVTTSSLDQLYHLTRTQALVEADWRKAQLEQTTQQDELNQTGNQLLFGSNPLSERIKTQGGTLSSTTNALT